MNDEEAIGKVKYRKNCGRCYGTGWADQDPNDIEHGADITCGSPCSCWRDIKQNSSTLPKAKEHNNGFKATPKSCPTCDGSQLVSSWIETEGKKAYKPCPDCTGKTP